MQHQAGDGEHRIHTAAADVLSAQNACLYMPTASAFVQTEQSSNEETPKTLAPLVSCKSTVPHVLLACYIKAYAPMRSTVEYASTEMI